MVRKHTALAAAGAVLLTDTVLAEFTDAVSPGQLDFPPRLGPALRCHGSWISFNSKGHAKPGKMGIGNSCIEYWETRRNAALDADRGLVAGWHIRSNRSANSAPVNYRFKKCDAQCATNAEPSSPIRACPARSPRRSSPARTSAGPGPPGPQGREEAPVLPELAVAAGRGHHLGPDLGFTTKRRGPVTHSPYWSRA